MYYLGTIKPNETSADLPAEAVSDVSTRLTNRNLPLKETR